MLVHPSATINRRVLLAVSPIFIQRLEFAAATALLLMVMIFLVIRIHGAVTTITPNNSETRRLIILDGWHRHKCVTQVSVKTRTARKQ